MNTASLELCEELERLSGWNDTYFRWAKHGEDSFTGQFVNKPEYPPAYDLGYLQRKLRDYAESYNGEGLDNIASSLHPEDDYCKLAIKLLKSGVLESENKTSQQASPKEEL